MHANQQKPRPLGTFALSRKREINLVSNAHSSSARVYRSKDRKRVYNDITDSSWRGYIGTWYVDLHDPALAKELSVMRTFKWRDPSTMILDHTNVYSAPRPGTAPREVDALMQKEFVYQGATFAPEHLEDPVPITGSTLLVAEPDCITSLGSFSLPQPPQPLAAGDVPSGGIGAWETKPRPGAVPERGPPAGGGGVWGTELFIRDRDCRWSVVLLYGTGIGALTLMTYIREYGTTADPATANVLTACRDIVRPARPPLSDDPASWVTHGSVGRRTSRLWLPPGGPQLMLDDSTTEDVEWTLPRGDPSLIVPPASTTSGSDTPGTRRAVAVEPLPYVLLRLPDSMYLSYPASTPFGAVPAAAADGQQPAAGAGGRAGNPGEDVVFEFGGLLRSGAGLQRMRVRYDRATGSFVDVVREVF